MIGLALPFLLACGTSAPEPSSDGAINSQEQSLGTTNAEGRGYVHAVAKSRFRLGATTGQKSEFGMAKVVGAYGVFATVEGTGWSMGIPNADAPNLTTGRSSWSGTTHNKAVLGYFQDSGLPSAQVLGVDAHANIHAGGFVGTPEADLAAKPLSGGYTSCLRRGIGGIPVPDSFAWAGIDDNGDVIEEAIYWPEIPASVIADAKALAAKLADPAAAQAFRNAVSDTSGEGEVVIRHASGVAGTPFTAVASYDRIDGNVVRHFDAAAREVKLPDEQPLKQAPRK